MWADDESALEYTIPTFFSRWQRTLFKSQKLGIIIIGKDFQRQYTLHSRFIIQNMKMPEIDENPQLSSERLITMTY